MSDADYTISEEDLRARIDGIATPYDRYAVMRLKPGVLRAMAQDLELDKLHCVKRDIPAGFHFVANLSTGSVVEPAFLFLVERAVGIGDHRKAARTIEAYAYDLRAWFEYLALCEATWDTATDDHLTDYMLELGATAFEEPGEEGFQYARATIQRHLSTIISFYKDTQRNGLTSFCLSAKIGKALGRAPESVIRPVPLENLKQLIASLGPRPSKRQEGETSRLWLCAMIALLGGLRRSEVCALNADQILRIPHDPASPLREHALQLTKTKGSVPRTVLLQGFLVQELKRYIEGERAEILSGSHRGDTRALFVNHRTAGAAAGDRLSPVMLGRDFVAAVGRAGLLRPLLGHRYGAGASTSGHTFHDLRHTCACIYYVSARSQGADPWIEAQRRLGHALIETTRQVYLRHVHEFEGKVDGLVQSLVLGMLN